MNKIKYYIIIVSLVIIICVVSPLSIVEGFTENTIPLHIYQTWETKNLPPKMKKCVEKLKKDNPEFSHFLFDDNDCLLFIRENFDENVVNAYNRLIPGAYKADLWRYCVLYINGGIYLDIKYCNVSGFKLKQMTDKEYFVKDISENGGGIYNAFLVCKAKNPKLKRCINQIAENVQNKYYGTTALDITGPMLMKNEFTESEINNLELTLGEKDCPTKTCIYWKNIPILSIYSEYREEQKEYNYRKNTKSYYDLWKDRNVYG